MVKKKHYFNCIECKKEESSPQSSPPRTCIGEDG